MLAAVAVSDQTMISGAPGSMGPGRLPSEGPLPTAKARRSTRRELMAWMSRGASAGALGALLPIVPGGPSAGALGAFLPIASGGPSPGEAHGRVNPPVPVPDIGVIRHDGVATTLAALCRGHATALQVMFTACKTTCPIQGAIFARVQRLLPDQLARGVQLVSLSVDPAHDDPRALTLWLRRFHARPGWIAVAPRPADVERVRDFAGRGRSVTDNHSTQVQLLDRDARLVWRTSELPEAEELAAALRKM
jgi:protein SCO1/2